MEPTISVITPFSRGIKELTTLFRDFRNQTFKNFEHVIVADGKPPENIMNFVKDNCPSYTKFVIIEKDKGNMSIAPGTRPRNHGVTVATATLCCWADDDDRYRSDYLESLAWNLPENSIGVVQMTCQESRIFKNGDPKKIRLIPEVGLPYFPIICHVGTPCFCVPRKWALESPWQNESEHDFRFIKRIVEKYNPQIRFKAGMFVDVDGLVTKDITDWVTIPPYSR